MSPQETQAYVLRVLHENGPLQNYLIRAKLPGMWDYVYRVDRAIQQLRKDGKIRRVGMKWEAVS